MLEIHPHPFRHRLKTLGITQFHAAHYLGISQPSLSQRLMGYRPFSIEQEARLGALIAELEIRRASHAKAER